MLESIDAHLTGLASIAVSLMAIAGFIAAFFRWALPAIKKIGDVVDTVHLIGNEFRPNGGSSMKDALNRVEKGMQRIDSRQWALASIQRDPIFESDEMGNCIRANASYLSLAERSIDEVLGRGWENTIALKCRAAVTTEWDDATDKGRPFEAEFQVVGSSTRKVYNVKCISTPYRTDSGEVLGYVGRYVKVEEANA